AGLYFSLFRAFECPVSGKRAALPRQNPKTGRRVEANFAALATGRKVRLAEVAQFCRTSGPVESRHRTQMDRFCGLECQLMPKAVAP
ncbi:MAG: hypothetical protein AB3N13_02950, partial [Arenibacterium sp.]